MAELIDITAFIDTDYRIDFAWRDGEQIVATDGRSLIVADVAAVLDNPHISPWPGDRRQPRWQDALTGIGTVTGWQPLPPFPACSRCDNDGYLLEDCQKCGGHGECHCPHCEASHDCGACDGGGHLLKACGQCDILIDGSRFPRRLMNRLLRLPGVEVAVQRQTRPPHTLFFRFSGGRGGVSGIHQRQEETADV